MRMVCLIYIGILAMLWDFYTRRIPNLLTGAGLIAAIAWQWSANGPPGLLEFFSASLMTLLLFSPLHYFRMLGAGDIKYFMVTGGFLGLHQNLKCICVSFLIAAVFSIAVMIKYRIFTKRLILLIQYMKEYTGTGVWKPYITGEADHACLHMSLPIFLGSVLVTGGWI